MRRATIAGSMERKEMVSRAFAGTRPPRGRAIASGSSRDRLETIFRVPTNQAEERMADRCEHCETRLDGLMPHADSCPTKNEEIRERAENMKEENEVMKDLLQRYSDRCPCRIGSPCRLCDEASAFL